MHGKIEVLEENLSELRAFFRDHSLEAIRNKKSLEWALRYGLLESIQSVIDISCQLVSANNLGTPGTYGECISLLARHGYIEKDFSIRLEAMVGLRNLLIHEYTSIDLARLYALSEHLQDFQIFLNSLEPYM